MSILKRQPDGPARRTFKISIASGLTAWLLFSVPVFAAKPAIVVSLKSYDELQKDAQYLATTLQQPPLGALLPGLVGQVTGGRGLKGLDPARRIGAFAVLAAEGKPADVVVIVPVNDQKMFSETLAAIFPNPAPAKDLTQYQLPDGSRQFFGKPGAKHFLFSLNSDSLTDEVDPDKILKSTADIGIDLDLTQIPDGLKQLVVDQIEAGAAAAAAEGRRANADNAAYLRGEELGREVPFKALRSVLIEAERVSMAVNVDSQGKSISLDLEFTSRPNTPLASAVASYAKNESPFAGMVSGKTVGSLLVSLPLAAEVGENLKQLIDAGEESGLRDVEKAPAAEQENARRGVKLIIDAARQCLQRGRLDQALVVNATGTGMIQVVAASKVDNAGDLKREFEEVVRKVPDAAKVVKLSAAQVGSAPIHAISLPPDAEREKLFGSGPAHLAFGSDAVFFALGEDSLGALKTALESRPDKQSRAPISLRIGMSRLLPLIERANPEFPPGLGKAAFGGGTGNDEIALEVLSQPQGARIRFQIQEGVARLIGLFAAAQQGNR